LFTAPSTTPSSNIFTLIISRGESRLLRFSGTKLENLHETASAVSD